MAVSSSILRSDFFLREEEMLRSPMISILREASSSTASSLDEQMIDSTSSHPRSFAFFFIIFFFLRAERCFLVNLFLPAFCSPPSLCPFSMVVGLFCGDGCALNEPLLCVFCSLCCFHC